MAHLSAVLSMLMQPGPDACRQVDPPSYAMHILLLIMHAEHQIMSMWCIQDVQYSSHLEAARREVSYQEPK